MNPACSPPRSTDRQTDPARPTDHAIRAVPAHARAGYSDPELATETRDLAGQAITTSRVAGHGGRDLQSSVGQMVRTDLPVGANLAPKVLVESTKDLNGIPLRGTCLVPSFHHTRKADVPHLTARRCFS